MDPNGLNLALENIIENNHCVKYSRILAFTDPYLPVLEQNRNILSLNSKIQVKENPFSGVFMQRIPFLSPFYSLVILILNPIF